MSANIALRADMRLVELVNRYVSERVDLTASSEQQLLVTVAVVEKTLRREISITDLSVALLREFLRSYQGAPATANGKVANVATVWRYAAQLGMVAPPDQNFPKLKEPRRVPRAWCLQDFVKIVTASKELPGRVGPYQMSEWFPALLLTAYSTAPRISSLMGLKTRDVSLRDRWAVIYAHKGRKESAYRLTDQCVSALSLIWDKDRTDVFGNWPNDRTQRGWPALNDLLKRCIVSAGVPDIGRFHAIRRTSATLVYNRDPFAAQRLLGHTELSLTEKHYIDPTKLTLPLPSDLLPTLAI